MSTGYGSGYAYGESSVAFAPAMNGREIPQVEVKADVPEVGVSRTPIEITFTFTNKTESLLPLELSITDSNNFMFSGNKQINLSLDPQSSHKEVYILFPLICGKVSLPRLRLVAFPDSPEAQPLDGLLDVAIPHFIQIMPKGSS